eukprot:317304-Chlamydomonas_euryale.AAC.1
MKGWLVSMCLGRQFGGHAMGEGCVVAEGELGWGGWGSRATWEGRRYGVAVRGGGTGWRFGVSVQPGRAGVASVGGSTAP